MADPIAEWTETESEVYRSLSRYAVPEREQQVALVAALVAAARPDGAILDLCCGEGLLTAALLRDLPQAELLAYDGSDSMLAATRARAMEAAARLTLRRIDIAAADWRRFDRPLRAAVSSLAAHHLDGPGKQALFADLYRALAPGGVFVLADIVQPATEAGRQVAADLWDEAVRRRALALDGGLDGYDAFRREGWNLFRQAEPDPIDKPSTIVEQLDWLRAAGFADVDLHWMTAGQAIVSAWRP